MCAAVNNRKLTRKLCNRFHATRANSGKIIPFYGIAPLLRPPKWLKINQDNLRTGTTSVGCLVSISSNFFFLSKPICLHTYDLEWVLLFTFGTANENKWRMMWSVKVFATTIPTTSSMMTFASVRTSLLVELFGELAATILRLTTKAWANLRPVLRYNPCCLRSLKNAIEITSCLPTRTSPTVSKSLRNAELSEFRII